MPEDNPFTAPEIDEAAVDRPEALADYDFKRLQKLYYRSCNVSGIGGLLVLADLYLLAMATGATIGLKTEPGLAPVQMVALGVLALYLPGTVGVFLRSHWGRALGIVCCVVMLISIPLGTIAGVFGLAAFTRAKELFGPDRIRHRELKAAFRAAKRERKEARRAAKRAGATAPTG